MTDRIILQAAVRCCREQDCEHCPLMLELCDELDMTMERIAGPLLDRVEETLGGVLRDQAEASEMSMLQ